MFGVYPQSEIIVTCFDICILFTTRINSFFISNGTEEKILFQIKSGKYFFCKNHEPEKIGKIREGVNMNLVSFFRLRHCAAHHRRPVSCSRRSNADVQQHCAKFSPLHPMLCSLVKYSIHINMRNASFTVDPFFCPEEWLMVFILSNIPMSCDQFS